MYSVECILYSVKSILYTLNNAIYCKHKQSLTICVKMFLYTDLSIALS